MSGVLLEAWFQANSLSRLEESGCLTFSIACPLASCEHEDQCRRERIWFRDLHLLEEFALTDAELGGEGGDIVERERAIRHAIGTTQVAGGLAVVVDHRTAGQHRMEVPIMVS